MKYYDILTQLQTLYAADIDVNTVTQGGLDEVDLNKQTMYSMAHIMVNNANNINAMIDFNCTVYVMDIVDIAKETVTDIFIGNDNETDVLNTTLSTHLRVMDQLRRGDVSENGYQLQGAVSFEPFTDRFLDRVAGWAATFTVRTPTNMTIC